MCIVNAVAGHWTLKYDLFNLWSTKRCRGAGRCSFEESEEAEVSLFITLKRLRCSHWLLFCCCWVGHAAAGRLLLKN